MKCPKCGSDSLSVEKSSYEPEGEIIIDLLCWNCNSEYGKAVATTTISNSSWQTLPD